jgi:hypothetical protein
MRHGGQHTAAKPAPDDANELRHEKYSSTSSNDAAASRTATGKPLMPS